MIVLTLCFCPVWACSGGGSGSGAAAGDGGQNGAADRRAYWATAKDTLGAEEDITSVDQMSSTVDPEVLAEMARSLPESEAQRLLELVKGSTGT